MFKKTTVLVLAILATLPVLADRVEIDETRKTTSDGEVSVELLAGTIDIVGWDRDEVQVTGTYDDDYQEFEIDSEMGEVSIEVDLSEGEHRDSGDGTYLKIRLPRDNEVEVEAISADITVEDVTGEVDIEVISGDIEISGGTEEFSVECVSGDVEIETSAALRRAGIETVSGSVELRGALAKGARLSVESVNGNVTLRLPSSTSAEFEISTFNGSIKNDFGPPAKKTSKYLPARELSFSMGSGDASVTIEAFNGSVRLIEE